MKKTELLLFKSLSQVTPLRVGITEANFSVENGLMLELSVLVIQTLETYAALLMDRK